MEKYGVDVERQSRPLDGEDPGVCPRCGVALPPDEDGAVPRCRDCGTEPFEVG